MDLVHYGDVLDQDIRRLATRQPAAAMGKASLELSDKLREHAIMALLVEEWFEGFSANLVRSGVSRLIFLERTKGGEIDSPYSCSSFFSPLVDTIAGGDLNLAARITKVTPYDGKVCGDSHDYYYSQILQGLAVGTPHSDLQETLQGFVGAKDGGARLEVSRALVESDGGAFDAAFERLLDQEQRSRGTYSEWDFPAFEKKFDDFGGFDAVMEVHNGIRTDDESLEAFDDIEGKVRRAGRQVFIEGLALLQLAESRGLPARESYRYCPRKARNVRNTSFDWAEFVYQVPQASGVK